MPKLVPSSRGNVIILHTAAPTMTTHSSLHTPHTLSPFLSLSFTPTEYKVDCCCFVVVPFTVWPPAVGLSLVLLALVLLALCYWPLVLLACVVCH
jgi:hypothetical protein